MDKRRNAFIVRGGPGTGKSVTALKLLWRSFRQGFSNGQLKMFGLVPEVRSTENGPGAYGPGRFLGGH
jgi:hypothetical protein